MKVLLFDCCRSIRIKNLSLLLINSPNLKELSLFQKGFHESNELMTHKFINLAVDITKKRKNNVLLTIHLCQFLFKEINFNLVRDTSPLLQILTPS